MNINGGSGGGGGSSSAGKGGAGGSAGTAGQMQTCRCADGCGSCSMLEQVEVPIYGFSIDVTEVTNRQYAAFLDASVPSQSATGPEICDWNETYLPSSNWVGQTDQLPVVFVDWCDATAYCAWAGGHLCGKIGGGVGSHFDTEAPTLSEWYNACSGAGIYAYSYGSAAVAGTCNLDTDMLQPVKALAGCHGSDSTYATIFDMVGNVFEWTNEEFVDSWIIRGGSASTSWQNPDVSCPSNWTSLEAEESDAFVGFRCCYGE